MTFDNLCSYFVECPPTGLWVFRENMAEVKCSHLVKSGPAIINKTYHTVTLSSLAEVPPDQSQHSPISKSNPLESQSAAHTQGKGKLSSTYWKGSIYNTWNSFR